MSGKASFLGEVFLSLLSSSFAYDFHPLYVWVYVIFPLLDLKMSKDSSVPDYLHYVEGHVAQLRSVGEFVGDQELIIVNSFEKLEEKLT